MKKRNIILIVLSVLLLCFGWMQRQFNAAPEDVNLTYMSNIREPDYCRIHFDSFEPPFFSEREDCETRHITDTQALERIADDALGRIGDMISPPLDCENSDAYWFTIEQTTDQNYSCVELYFLVEDGVFKPVVYAEFAFANRVWYTFDNPQEFVETYWNLAEPSK